MTRKWLSLSNGHEQTDVQSEDNIRRVVEQVERVLRSNAIPHNPWVLIAMLQNVDSAQGPAAKNGSYGHLFEAIITFALDASKYRKIDIKGKYPILSEYAYELYQRNVASLDDQEVALFFRAYKDKYEIDFEESKLCDDLAEIGLLRRDDFHLSFSSKFSYCFFVANYLARHIHEEHSRAIIRSLSERLFHEESANIIVFLAHLSSDPIVLDEMKLTAAGLFRESPLATFADDVKPINALCHIDMRLSLPASTPDENRKLEQEAWDESLVRRDRGTVDGRAVEPQPARIDRSAEEAYASILRIQASKRTIQILGQVLRNGASSIPGPEKRVIVHEIYRLGRRLLGMIYGQFPDGWTAWRDELKGKYRGEHKGASEAEGLEQAHRHIFELYWLATLGVVTLVAEATGLDLLRETFRRVLEEDPSLPNQVVDLAIKLERPGKLPNKDIVELYHTVIGNRLMQLTLRSLVVNHLYLYDVPREDKQQVCSKLNITLPPEAVSPRQKRLTPESRRRRPKSR